MKRKLNLLLITSLFVIYSCDKNDDDENTQTIEIDQPINASASFTASALGEDLDSRYTYKFNSVLENTSVFVWNFGDGNTSSEPNPTHTYSRAGDYTVKLTVYGIPATGTLLGPADQLTQSISIEGPKAIDYIPGTWRPYNLYVGPSAGSGEWWNYGANGSRPCLEDDVYTFTSDGKFTISHGDGTWLEDWQTGNGDYCGTPISPYVDGSFTWSLATGNVLTLNGDGAYLVLPKATNNGQDGIASSRSYDVLNISPTTMQIAIEAGGGVWWTLELVKN